MATYTKRRPLMGTLPIQERSATDPPHLDDMTDHQLLVESTDYARRIHWWVRFFAIVSLVGAALTVCFVAYFAVAVSNQQKLDKVNCTISGTCNN